VNKKNYIIVYQIIIKDIEIMKTTETASSASFLDIYHKLDTNAGNGQLFTRLYGKGDDFNFVIINYINKMQLTKFGLLICRTSSI
jgi:hypothetical protein